MPVDSSSGSLADLVENRRLVLCMLACAAMAAAGVALNPNCAFLLAVLFILGAACSAIQILVPLPRQWHLRANLSHNFRSFEPIMNGGF